MKPLGCSSAGSVLNKAMLSDSFDLYAADTTWVLVSAVLILGMMPGTTDAHSLWMKLLQLSAFPCRTGVL